jgi:glycosyltransferase involved in cell wall biosynthesis
MDGAISPQAADPKLASSAPTEDVAVVISTRGRPKIVAALIERLCRQTRRPDQIFVIASAPDDIAELSAASPFLTVAVGRPGLTRQRNDGLALLGSKFSHVVFFDDDFVPSVFWIERMIRVFNDHPDIAGMTGSILADGIHGAGINLDDANAQVERQDAAASHGTPLQLRFPYGHNVGSNMAYRWSAISDLRFDERLPLYGWHEDSDFRAQVEKRGLFIKAPDVWGIHLGHKAGRVNGTMLGYSQIANVAYLARKGTAPKRFLLESAIRNVLSNLIRYSRPEPFIDRRGRLHGNMLALRDMVCGRLSPERVSLL